MGKKDNEINSIDVNRKTLLCYDRFQKHSMLAINLARILVCLILSKNHSEEKTDFIKKPNTIKLLG